MAPEDRGGGSLHRPRRFADPISPILRSTAIRSITALVGVVLCSAGFAGFALLGVGPRHTVQRDATRLAARLGLIALAPGPAVRPLGADELAQLAPAVTLDGAQAAAEDAARHAEPVPTALPARLRIPRIGLAAEVVTAQLVEVGGALTWDVPAHRVGHAQGTAGAGATGNMVLLGHVTSLDAGSVFHDLDRVAVGDAIEVATASSAAGQTFTYRVVDVRRVERGDTSVLAPTDQPAVTLITCTGTWLPDRRDYSQRLAVRALLAPPAAS